jgi:hypothetical protein
MKKQLLQESEIRKFMKFANIGALTDGFVGRLSEAGYTDPVEEDVTEEALDPEAPPMDEPVDDVDDVEDVEAIEDPEAEEGLGELEISQEEAAVLVALGNRLEGELEAEPDLEDVPDLEAEPEPDLEMDMEDEELGEDLVNEVLARVARRLKASK